MRVSATAKYVRISPRKVRLVTDLIVGRPVEEAAAILRFMPNAAARDVAKVLRSATANAENNFNLTADELHVESAVANEGPTLKRIRPRAQGRAFQILKRTSHITVSVAEACRMVGVGRTVLYQALGEGRIRACKVGRKTLVTTQSLRDYVASLPPYNPAS